METLWKKSILKGIGAVLNRIAALLVVFTCMNPASAFRVESQNTHPDGYNDWKKKYQSVSEFGDVCVVKSIYSFCDEYDTWLADKSGKLLTPAYRDIGPFSDGRAEFVPKEGHNGLKGFHGYIDKRGKVVIPPVYHGAGEFRNGKAWVIYPADSLYGLSFIDTSGKVLHRLPVEPFSESLRINRLCAQLFGKVRLHRQGAYFKNPGGFGFRRFLRKILLRQIAEGHVQRQVRICRPEKR